MARDIGVGANGAAWIIGTNAVAGGYAVYRSNATANGWAPVPGGGTQIAVDATGLP